MATTILEAIHDPQLLGGAFRPRGRFQRDTWRAWRSFYATCFALTYDDARAFELYKKCTGRTVAPSRPFEEIVCIVGRRGGKSHAIAGLAAYLSTCRDYRNFLAPGERGVLAILAADKSQAGVLMNYCRSFIASSPTLSRLIQGETKESINLAGGIDVEVFAASAAGVRGRTLIGCLIDEGVFVSDIEEVVRALKPALSTIPGAPLITISSPWRKSGLVYSQFEKHFAKDDSDVLIWKAPSRLMNPTLSATRILAALATDRTAARTEFLGEWRDDLAAYLSEADLAPLIVPGRKLLPRIKDVEYFSHIDASGGKSDSMVCTISHRDGDKGVLDLIHEAKPPFVPEIVVAEQCQILKHFGVTRVRGDRYGAAWVSSAFERHGISYEPAEKSASDYYHEFLPLALSGRVVLLDDATMKSQFVALERRASRTKDLITHPPNSHDDVANAVSACLVSVLADERVFGVLDFARKSNWTWDGFVSAKTDPAASRQSEAQRNVEGMKRFLRRKPNFSPAPQPWNPEPCKPCEACGSACVIRIADFERCQQCGVQRWPHGLTVVSCGRNGPFARKIH